MVTQNLSLGDITLENVLTLPQTGSKKEEASTRIKEINDLLQGESVSTMETLPLTKLREEKAVLEARLNYPRLNLSFLSMANTTEYNGKSIYVPRFSVYSLDNNRFSMNVVDTWHENVGNIGVIGSSIGGAIVGVIFGGLSGFTYGNIVYGDTNGAVQFYEPAMKIGAAVGGGIGALVAGIGCFTGHNDSDDEKREHHVDFGRLPRIFSQELIKSAEFSKYAEPEQIKIRNQLTYAFKSKDIPKEIRKKHRKTGNVRVASQLHGLIPAVGRESIRRALRTFPRENLYMIAETKPEEWNVTKYIRDPLIVGIQNEDCFYVGSFNATPLEDYVEKEFK